MLCYIGKIHEFWLRGNPWGYVIHSDWIIWLQDIKSISL